MVRRARPATSVLLVLVALALLLGAPAPAHGAVPAITTVSFSGHPDDDLLFMNPDIVSDVQAHYRVWIVYMSAGDIPYRDGHTYGGIGYADMRIQGERAAWARGAHVANNWVFEPMTFAGHTLATNRLVGTNLRLIFTFVHAAGGPEDVCGDLYRMWHDPSFVAHPIDGRAPFTKATLISVVRAILNTAKPNYIRTHSTIGHREGDNVDHTSSALLVADADADAGGRTIYRRDEYLGYIVALYPDNVFGYWRAEKTAMWSRYLSHDPEHGPSGWMNVMGKEYRPIGRIFSPGWPWVPPGDFTSC